MATFGNTSIGAANTTVGSNAQRGGLFTLSESGRVTALKMYLDGSGGGAGTQVMKAALYENGATYPTARKALSAEVTVTAGQAAGWVTFTISPSVFLTAGDYWLDLHSGVTTNVARYYRDTTGGLLESAITDNYADGTLTTIPAGATITAHKMSAYAEYTPAWHPVTTAPTETVLDVIRVFKNMEGAYTDITSATPQGFANVRRTKVLNQPGGLEFDLAASTVKQLTEWIDENSLVEYWKAGARVGCYIVDDFTPSWGACTASVKCLGALGWAERALYDSAGSAIPTIDQSLMNEFVNEGVNGAIGMNIWQQDDAKVSIGSTSLDVAAGGSNCLDWLVGIAPLIGTYGARWWIDSAWYFNAALLGNPAGTADRTYVMGTSCFEFTTTYSAREIKNRVQVNAPNAPAPYFAVCDDLTSQETYGIRTHEAIDYEAAKSLAAATSYGNAQLASWGYPQLAMTLTVPHDETTEPGMVAEVTGLDDGRTYKGHVQQISWTEGDLSDEVLISYQPLGIRTAVR